MVIVIIKNNTYNSNTYSNGTLLIECKYTPNIISCSINVSSRSHRMCVYVMDGFVTAPGVEYKSHPGVEYKSYPEVEYKSHTGVEYKSHHVVEYMSHPGVEYKSHPGVEY
jgi:hypothetical protein